jgi:hypothetical protein
LSPRLTLLIVVLISEKSLPLTGTSTEKTADDDNPAKNKRIVNKKHFVFFIKTPISIF